MWFGGGADQVVDRIGRLGDGWFPQFQPDSAGQERIGEMREIATKAGRDPADIGIEGRLNYADGPDAWNRNAEAWAECGATHLSINTMRAGLPNPEAHIKAIEEFKQAVAG